MPEATPQPSVIPAEIVRQALVQTLADEAGVGNRGADDRLELPVERLEGGEYHRHD